MADVDDALRGWGLPGALNLPRPLAVEAVEGPDGPVPQWVVWRGKRRRVATVDDVWQVEDEWFSVSPNRIVGLEQGQDHPMPSRSARSLGFSARRAGCMPQAPGLPWQGEIQRRYFAVTLVDGCRLTLFLDGVNGTWWEQRY